MSKSGRVVVAICLWSCLQGQMVSACRYNVRDVGFVDLGGQRYHLYGYVGPQTPADIISSLKQISYTALLDSSIKVEIINTGQQKDHPAIEYVDLLQIQSLPALVLVSPSGEALAIDITQPGQPFKQGLWSVLENIVSSPKRDEIVQQVSKTFGVVLLIEGPEPNENKRAAGIARGAIEKISGYMELMPKTIARPPVPVVIERETFSREKVLLWSLGLDANKINEPYAAVLYGRGRLMGPVLKGEEITESRLINFLSVIGADCECGLDRRWMQGVMLPVRWDEQLQAQAVKDLGFDPENPMVKMEVSRILRQGQTAAGGSRGQDSFPNVPYGYQELVIEFDSGPNSQRIAPVQVESAGLDAAEGPSSLAESHLPLRNVIFVFIGLALLVLICGVGIGLRAKRK